MKIIQAFLISLIFLFPFGQLTRLPLPVSPAIRVYAQDIVIVTLLIMWIGYTAIHRKNILIPPAFRYIVYIVAAGLVSLLVHAFRYPLTELVVGSLYLARWIAYAGLYPLIYNLTHKDHTFSKLLIYLLSAAGIVSAVFGLVQYFWYPNLRNLIYLGWDPHEYRVFGTFFDSGFTGLIYVLTILLIVSIWPRKKWQLMAGTMLTYAALALTYSRASFLALFSGIMVVSVMRKTFIPLAVITVLLALTVFSLPTPSPTAEGTKLERTTSVNARLSNYAQSREIIMDYPLFGIGFNMLRFENRNRGFVPVYEWEESNAAAGLDNSLLFLLATMGIAGFVTYVLFIFQVIQHTKKHYRVLMGASLVAVLAHSMFNNSLFYPWVMLWMWILIAIAHVPRRL